MNRTERLYALVEELRAVSPRPRSATWLARRFEVSTRTVERDLRALLESGVPVRAAVGRSGGYSLDRDRTLPPMTLTAWEATAISVALRSAATSPFATAARMARQKVRAALPRDVREQERALADRVHLVGEHLAERAGLVTGTVQRAVADGQVLEITYRDRAGRPTARVVEPLGLLWGPQNWYLIAWCRLRQGVRGFALDRIEATSETGERAPRRQDALRAELARLAAQPLPS